MAGQANFGFFFRTEGIERPDLCLVSCCSDVFIAGAMTRITGFIGTQFKPLLAVDR
jgi:hypothetical protein